MSHINPAEHIGLIKKVVGKLSRAIEYTWMTDNDLISYGYIPLTNACKYFDPTKGRFSTYACRVIYNYLINLIFENQGAYRVPAKAFRKYKRPNREKLFDLLDNSETERAHKELIEHLHASINKLSPLEQKVIKLRFGMECDEHTQLQTCKVIRRAKGTVRKLERKSLEKLRSLIVN